MFRILHITNEIFFPDPYRLIRIFGLENFASVFLQNRGETLILKKMLNFLSFLVLLYVSGRFKQKKFFKIFLTDRKISSPINYMIWWGNFSISQKNFEKKFFAWNVLKHKVKPKNSRNSTFFQKLKCPPYFWKTLVKISSPKSLWYAVIFLSPREGKFKPQKYPSTIAAIKKRSGRVHS